MTIQKTISTLLDAVEAEMQRNGMWQEASPSAAALASLEPFAIDTLSFDEWLQWIFIAKLRTMIDVGAPLPSSCSVAPMAEESWARRSPEPKEIIALLVRIDLTLSAPASRHLQ